MIDASGGKAQAGVDDAGCDYQKLGLPNSASVSAGRTVETCRGHVASCTDGAC